VSHLAVVLAACAACLGPPPAGASSQNEREAPYAPPAPVTCESFAALVDTTLVEWQTGSPGTHFIVIARPGTRERAGLGRPRLRKVEVYLRQRLSQNEKYIVAEGGRARGPGRIEVYVAGRLRAAIPLKRNDSSVCSGKVNPFL
jgi:hypothetical protein